MMQYENDRYRVVYFIIKQLSKIGEILPSRFLKLFKKVGDFRINKVAHGGLFDTFAYNLNTGARSPHTIAHHTLFITFRQSNKQTRVLAAMSLSGSTSPQVREYLRVDWTPVALYKTYRSEPHTGVVRRMSIVSTVFNEILILRYRRFRSFHLLLYLDDRHFV